MLSKGSCVPHKILPFDLTLYILTLVGFPHHLHLKSSLPAVSLKSLVLPLDFSHTGQLQTLSTAVIGSFIVYEGSASG